MSIWLDKKYIGLLSGRLKDFKWKKSGKAIANFKCPFCEHDHTSRKSRGYFVERDNKIFAFCHNDCGSLGSLKFLLKKIDPVLFRQYQMEEMHHFGKDDRDVAHKLKNKISYKNPGNGKEDTRSEFDKVLKSLPSISSLVFDHPAKLYCQERKIPLVWHSLFKWVPKFMAWTNQLQAGKFDSKALFFDEGRLVIPFLDPKNNFFAYTGRSISGSEPRYIRIVLDDHPPCLFGLNRVDFRHPIRVVEGPIDAIYVDNCLAMAGSNFADLTRVSDPDNIILIYDNEPDKPDTKKKILKAIKAGYNVVVWPKWIKYKDINEMVVQGDWSDQYISELIQGNTYRGRDAQLRLEAWSNR